MARLKLSKFNSDRLIWLLTVVLFTSFYIFEKYSWYKFLLAAIAILLVLVSSSQDNGRIRFTLRPFHYYVALFSLYCAASILWAWDQSYSINQTRGMLRIFICFSLLYTYFEKRPNIDSMLQATKWAGIALTLYSFIRYGGINGIKLALETEERLQSSFANVNTIGMLAAMSCVLQAYEVVFLKKNLYQTAFVIPCVFMVAATQSRKALILLVLGIFLVIAVRNIDNRHFFVSFLRVVAIIVVGVLLIRFFASFDIFAGINSRMEGLYASLKGSAGEDSSARLRRIYRQVGWAQFLKTPILGIGIGSSGELLARETSHRTYIHNNYIELLACGGLAGFLLYYAMYAYLLKWLLKYRKLDENRTAICIIMILLLLIMDYGAVSYYSKERYFYLMMFFIEVFNIQKMSAVPEGTWETKSKRGSNTLQTRAIGIRSTQIWASTTNCLTKSTSAGHSRL